MEVEYNSKKDFMNDIQRLMPGLVFLSGKTCTGKTTIAKELSAIGYQSIQLDHIIVRSVVEKYGLEDDSKAFCVYRGEAQQEWIDSFIELARTIIHESMSIGPVVVEGALASSEIIKSLFSGSISDFNFVFLLPHDIQAYTDRVQERFVIGIESNTSGLPMSFFDKVDMTLVEDYLRTKIISRELRSAISNFAGWSNEESENRLKHFHISFPMLTVVNT